MISKFELKVLKNNPRNLEYFKKIGNNETSREFHILRNKSKLALILHFLWKKCEYCNLDVNDDGIIDL